MQRHPVFYDQQVLDCLPNILTTSPTACCGVLQNSRTNVVLHMQPADERRTVREIESEELAVHVPLRFRRTSQSLADLAPTSGLCWVTESPGCRMAVMLHESFVAEEAAKKHKRLFI